ncbi:hypothetical protein GCK32_009606 [Trichostrongylus colubriformis]|uniref:Uncharacterized protein n=1 Tax=Trichostrongylus colubriformis TaxID=6319 RepID=A0AAN8FSI8_TRICO
MLIPKRYSVVVCAMVYELVLLLLSCAFIVYLIGCANKERPTAGASQAQNSACAPPRSDQKPPKAAATQSKKEAPGPSAMNPATKSKMGDDGGYEACPDMTPSELARAANMNAASNKPVSVK